MLSRGWPAARITPPVLVVLAVLGSWSAELAPRLDGAGDVGGVVVAGLLAAAASASLVAGAAIGLRVPIPQRAIAGVMAFGAGALIEALAVELAFEGAEDLVHGLRVGGLAAWTYVATGFLAGCALYSLADKALEKRGGALRKPSTARAYFEEQRREAASALLDRLSKVNILRSVPPEEMDELLRRLRPVEVPAGQIVFRAGDPGDALYLIDRGRVDILNAGIDPARTRLVEEGYAPLASLGPGDSFGEIALLSGDARTASAVAAEDTLLLRVAKDDFDRLIVRSPSLRDAVQQLNLERVMRSARIAPGIEASRWRELALRSVRRVSDAEQEALARRAMEEHGTSAPVAIFLGAVLDGIPSSVIIGAQFSTLGAFDPTFLFAVMIANVPQAMSSAAGMRRAGFAPGRVYALWLALTIASGFAGALGNAALAGAPVGVTTLVEAVGGGAILAMLASSMMPEAFEEGGAVVRFPTVLGFLTAFLFTSTKLA